MRRLCIKAILLFLILKYFFVFVFLETGAHVAPEPEVILRLPSARIIDVSHRPLLHGFIPLVLVSF